MVIDEFRIGEYQRRFLPDDTVFRTDKALITLVLYGIDYNFCAEAYRGGEHIVQIDDRIRSYFQEIDGLAEPFVLRLERGKRGEVIEAVYAQDNADVFPCEITAIKI